MNSYRFLLLFLIFNLSACQKGSSQFASDSEQKNIKIIEAFPALSFERPVDLQNMGDNRLFVIEQKGLISVFDNNPKASVKRVFLNIQKKVDFDGNEEGLLGLAFDPNFKTNGFFYINYTVKTSETVVSRFKISAANPAVGDPNSELILLRFHQPYSNHNGGSMAFGPDGYLYISSGDGGSGNDPHGNGQNLETMLGKILRIDVSKPENGKNYAIPTDNPFINTPNARKEIFAYGLRNPWRMSFDFETKRLWCADVGQNEYEEVDIIENGKNYGWNTMEGLHTFKNGKSSPNFAAPVVEISHSSGDLSITGGYVYRGKNVPSLQGKYIFADYVSGRIYAIKESPDGKFINSLLIDQDQNISAFGTDSNRELYICAFDGKIYKLQE